MSRRLADAIFYHKRRFAIDVLDVAKQKPGMELVDNVYPNSRRIIAFLAHSNNDKLELAHHSNTGRDSPDRYSATSNLLGGRVIRVIPGSRGDPPLSSSSNFNFFLANLNLRAVPADKGLLNIKQERASSGPLKMEETILSGDPFAPFATITREDFLLRGFSAQANFRDSKPWKRDSKKFAYDSPCLQIDVRAHLPSALHVSYALRSFNNYATRSQEHIRVFFD
ncbi:hypothetical protein C8R47DRAFT_1082362 [Mycena vitilis]|nr:hypothetical protein C8R47DRAFT_1082362 [Mycena vitilis]